LFLAIGGLRVRKQFIKKTISVVTIEASRNRDDPMTDVHHYVSSFDKTGRRRIYCETASFTK